MDFIRGQKSKISDLTKNFSNIEIAVAINGVPGMELDISCFGLDTQGKLSDDRYFIFFNQKSSPCGSLTIRNPKPGYNQVFGVNLTQLPINVRQLVITATIDSNHTMSNLLSSHIDIFSDGQKIAHFQFSGRDFGQEKAIMIAEIYYKDMWRFNANGQGFNGGLSALLAHFGGEEAPNVNIQAPPKAAQPSPKVSSPPTPIAPISQPPAKKEPTSPPVRLEKITLEKRGNQRTVNLKKGGQPIHINLNWDQIVQTKGGFFSSKKSVNADLDLGCMYQLIDGSKQVIQALGNSFGDRNGPPFIFLDQDDRDGTSTNGENLYILKPEFIERVLIFAMIYQGSVNFSEVNARLKITDQFGNETLIPLNSPDPTKVFCAVCIIEKQGEKISIKKEEQYFMGHSQCDQQFGFGFIWSAGSKT